MELGIKGKVAVITGGDSGIGLATAQRLLDAGAKVVLSDKSADDLKESVEKLNESEGKLAYRAADLLDYDEVVKLADFTEEKFGKAHIVVNCAGARGAAGDFLELSDEDWMNTIQIDLMGAVRVCRAFIPHLRDNDWGRLVLIASENALQPYEEESPYNACKAGVINLSKCLSRAYSKENILINCVSPAFVETPMTDAMMEKLAEERGTSMEEAVDWFLENKRPHLAVGRRGQPEEVANVIAFLCSALATYVNGVNYKVDGGAVETAFG